MLIYTQRYTHILNENNRDKYVYKGNYIMTEENSSTLRGHFICKKDTKNIAAINLRWYRTHMKFFFRKSEPQA